MYSDWQDRDGHDGDAWREENPSSPEPSFGNPDAWRGDVYSTVDEAWRGDVHMDEWPEWSAGPEYLMWKRLAEDEQ